MCVRILLDSVHLRKREKIIFSRVSITELSVEATASLAVTVSNSTADPACAA